MELLPQENAAMMEWRIRQSDLFAVPPALLEKSKAQREMTLMLLEALLVEAIAANLEEDETQNLW
jgi:hypothetical protein